LSSRLAQGPELISWLFVILLLCFGLLQCFLGYRILRVMLAILGFALGAIAGGALGSLPFTAAASPLLLFFGVLVGGLVGGVIGALLFALLYYVGVFLIGVELGVALAAMLGTAIGLSHVWLVMILLGIICGILSLLLQRTLIILATAFGGAWIAVICVMTFMHGFALLDYLTDPALPQMSPNVALGAWLALGAVGAMVQFAGTSQPDEKSPEAEDGGTP
jgi:hypothetical protein